MNSSATLGDFWFPNFTNNLQDHVKEAKAFADAIWNVVLKLRQKDAISQWAIGLTVMARNAQVKAAFWSRNEQFPIEEDTAYHIGHIQVPQHVAECLPSLPLIADGHLKRTRQYILDSEKEKFRLRVLVDCIKARNPPEKFMVK